MGEDMSWKCPSMGRRATSGPHHHEIMACLKEYSHLSYGRVLMWSEQVQTLHSKLDLSLTNFSFVDKRLIFIASGK